MSEGIQMIADMVGQGVIEMEGGNRSMTETTPGHAGHDGEAIKTHPAAIEQAQASAGALNTAGENLGQTISTLEDAEGKTENAGAKLDDTITRLKGVLGIVGEVETGVGNAIGSTHQAKERGTEPAQETYPKFKENLEATSNSALNATVNAERADGWLKQVVENENETRSDHLKRMVRGVAQLGEQTANYSESIGNAQSVIESDDLAKIVSADSGIEAGEKTLHGNAKTVAEVQASMASAIASLEADMDKLKALQASMSDNRGNLTEEQQKVNGVQERTEAAVGILQNSVDEPGQMQGVAVSAAENGNRYIEVLGARVG